MAPLWDQINPAALSAMPWGEYARVVAGQADAAGAATVVALGAAAAGLSAAFGVPALNRRLLRPIDETRLWDLLPFDDVVQGGLRLRDGSLCAAVRVAGLDLTAAGIEEIAAKRARRRQWFADLDPHIVYRVFQSRRRIAWQRPGGTPPTRRVQSIIDTWFQQFAESYVLDTVVVLEVAGATQRARERLERAVEQTLSILDPFKPTRLVVDGEADPLLSFWGERINPANQGRLVVGRDGTRRLKRTDAARIGLTPDRVAELERAGAFGSGLPFRLAGGWVETYPDGLIRHAAGGSDDAFAFVVVVPMWGDGTAETLNCELLRVQGELTVVHRIRPISADDAQAMVKMAANNARSNEDDELTVAEQKAIADERLSPISTNKEGIGAYEVWVICYGRSRAEAQRTVRMVTQIMRDFSLRPRVCDKADAEHLYFGQFPTYNQPLRPCHFFTANLSDQIMFENVADGHSSCDWGPQPVLPLRTQYGTTFGFIPHATERKEALPHMLVIGQPGSGKTKFLQLVVTAALRFDRMHVMWFDRDFASAPWALAVDADYFDFVDSVGGLKPAKLNPLSDLDVSEPMDQQALRQWLALLCEDDGDEAMKAYARFLEFAEKTPSAMRSLDVIGSIAFGKQSAVWRSLQRWIDPKQLGGIWHAARDGLSLSRRINVFNMTSILDDARLAPPVVSYLWYRHRRAVRAAGGAPSMVVVDETRPLLASEVMRRDLLRELREGRRRRESVCLVFQEPSAIAALGDHDFTSTMRGSFGTQVLFPISGSKDMDWSAFELTPMELAFCKGLTRPECRYPALIRKPASGMSVIVDLDQTALGELELFLRGGQEFALAAHQARRVAPSDPATEYLAHAHRIVAGIQLAKGESHDTAR